MSLPRTAAQVGADQPGAGAEADQPGGAHPPRRRGLGGGEREITVDLRRGIRAPWRARGAAACPPAPARDDRRARNRRLARSVRRVTPVSPGACAVNRSITEECSSTSGTGSRPSPMAQSASLPAAHSRFFARSCPPGAAAVTTARANPAARGDTDDGCHRRIYAAVSAESIQDLYCKECARHRTPAAKMTACRPPPPSRPAPPRSPRRSPAHRRVHPARHPHRADDPLRLRRTAAATPTRPSCTAPTTSGPARSPAKPSPGS